jgi:hypothetical protein
VATKAERVKEILTRREHTKHESADYRWGFRAEDAWTIFAIPPYRNLDGTYNVDGQHFVFHIEPGDMHTQLTSIEAAVAGITPEIDLNPRPVVRRG